MPQIAGCAGLVVGLLLAGCSSIEGQDQKNYIIPGKTLNVSPSFTPSAEGIAAAMLIFVIVDPLAPNWHLVGERLDRDHYRLSLRMKRFITGGEGEALQVLRRHAERLARENGYAGYALVEYSEGVESQVPVAQRVAQGLIRFQK